MLASDKFFCHILESLDDGVAVMDAQRRVRYWNPAAERITGIPAAAMLNARCSDHHLQHFDADGLLLCRTRCPLDRALEAGEHCDRDIFVHRPDGERVPVRMRITPVLGPDGAPEGAVEVFTDNSGVAQALELAGALQDAACTDPLTGLGNRRFSEFRLAQEVERRGPRPDPLVIGLADIDHFKRCNDRFGHAHGDGVLRTVAAALRRSLRDSDFVGRWGGEEFLLVLPGCSLEAGVLAAERGRATVADSTAGVTVSFGLTPHHAGEDWAATVARADGLLYQSKREGRNRVTAS